MHPQIEMAWAKAKDWLRRNKDEVAAMDPFAAIDSALSSVTPEDGRGFFRHVAAQYCCR